MSATNPFHYRHGGLETYDYIEAKGLDYAEGNIVKYISRYKHKNGLEDLYKAEWYLKALIARVEREENNGEAPVRSDGSVDGDHEIYESEPVSATGAPRWVRHGNE